MHATHTFRHRMRPWKIIPSPCHRIITAKDLIEPPGLSIVLGHRGARTLTYRRLHSGADASTRSGRTGQGNCLNPWMGHSREKGDGAKMADPHAPLSPFLSQTLHRPEPKPEPGPKMFCNNMNRHVGPSRGPRLGCFN